MSNRTPYTSQVELRGWQSVCYRQWESSTSPDFLAEATPGSGKTILGLYAFAEARKAGICDRLVIVAPSARLVKQWAESAIAAFGGAIQLDEEYTNGRGAETADFDGIVTTYQSVARGFREHQFMCQRRRTMVIFDEIHHAGENKTWGDALYTAFGEAVRRLCLSGTPFRSDNSKIPFVNYEARDSGFIAKPDYRLTYGTALIEQYVRPVAFPLHDGDIEYVFGDDDMKWEGKLSVAKKRDEISRTLRTALSPDNEWIKGLLIDANEQLSLVRQAHPQAGGLLVCKDVPHARAILELLSEISGEKPVLVVSEDAGAQEEITRYSKSNRRWIVAVNMVSEGVDIKRLRVGVYATNIRTEMYFRQFVGRFVRVQKELDCDQTSYVYLPADPLCSEFAKTFQEERNHAIRMMVEEDEIITDEEVSEQADKEASEISFTPKFAGSPEYLGTVSDGVMLEITILEEAKRMKRDDPAMMQFPDYLIAKIIKASRNSGAGSTQEEPASTPGVFTEANIRPCSNSELRTDLSKKLAKKIRFCAMKECEAKGRKAEPIDFKVLGTEIRNAGDGKDQKQCTIEELRRRLKIVEERIKS